MFTGGRDRGNTRGGQDQFAWGQVKEDKVWVYVCVCVCVGLCLFIVTRRKGVYKGEGMV